MIRYPCPKCGEALAVDDSRAGRQYVCSLCGTDTTVPDRIIHEARLRELRAIHQTRHLTAEELTECAAHLRAIGNETEAVKAEQSSARQHERERQAAALEAAGVSGKKPAHLQMPSAPIRPRSIIVTGAIVAILLTTVALGGPYLTLASIRHAAERGDTTRLAELIDFPAVRESVKQQFMAAMSASIAQDPPDPSNPWAQVGTGIGMAIGANLVGAFVDNLLTPAAIANIVNGFPQSKAGTTTTSADVSMAGRFDSPSQFTMNIADANGKDCVNLVLTRQGLDWRLTDIRLPATLMS